MARLTLYFDDDDQIEVSVYDNYSFVKVRGLRVHVDKHDAAKALNVGEALIAEARKYLPPRAG